MRRCPDSPLVEQVDETGRPLNPPTEGDTLATFVVRELHDAFDPDAGDEAQAAEASRVIQRAAEDLLAVADALHAL